MNRATVEQQTAKINALEREKAEMVAAWVEAEHPLKIGDRVWPCGRYSFPVHKGKTMEVARVGVKETTFTGIMDHVPTRASEWWWTAHGWVINKNGEAGKLDAEWTRRVEE